LNKEKQRRDHTTAMALKMAKKKLDMWSHYSAEDIGTTAGKILKALDAELEKGVNK
jgi:hypothetical protein